MKTMKVMNVCLVVKLLVRSPSYHIAPAHENDANMSIDDSLTSNLGKRSRINTRCDFCHSNFDDDAKLRAHVGAQHLVNIEIETNTKNIKSSINSPPRKKLDKVTLDTKERTITELKNKVIYL